MTTAQTPTGGHAVRPATSSAASRASDDDAFGQWTLAALALLVLIIAVVGLI